MQNWSRLNFQRMAQADIIPLQQKLEAESFQAMAALDAELQGKSPDKAQELVTAFGVQRAESVLRAWKDLQFTLFAKYSDGYVNTKQAVREVGYPAGWLARTDYAQGPTSYSMPLNVND